MFAGATKVSTVLNNQKPSPSRENPWVKWVRDFKEENKKIREVKINTAVWQVTITPGKLSVNTETPSFLWCTHLIQKVFIVLILQTWSLTVQCQHKRIRWVLVALDFVVTAWVQVTHDLVHVHNCVSITTLKYCRKHTMKVLNKKL